MDTEITPVKQNPAIKFAEDVLFVYDYLGRRLTRRRAGGSTARVELHTWVHETPENKKEFLKTMVPNAQAALMKLAGPENSEEMMTVEKKAIVDLKRLLQEALAASQSLDPAVVAAIS